MRRIDKGPEPLEWQQYRNSPDASFDADGAKEPKEKLREYLLKEQGAVCAYCQRRISLTHSTRIEHIISQSVLKGDPKNKKIDNDGDKWWFAEQKRYYGKFDELCYRNIVLCCDGNVDGTKYGKQDPTKFHCDRKKGERCVHFDLFSNAFFDTISYKLRSGKIVSSDKAFNNEINDVLNLNVGLLCRNRLEAIQGIEAILKKNNWATATIKKLISQYESLCADGSYKPYSGIVLFYLNRKLRKLGVKRP